jgi:serine/threonine protein kinase/lipoprotein NlpI
MSTNSDDYAGQSHSACDPGADREALVAHLAEDMADSWGQGRFHRVEHYLDLHPELRGTLRAVMDLLYEELSLCREHGQPVNPQQVIQRFPHWEAHIKVLLGCMVALEAAPVPAIPEVGETLGDFRLLAVLGEGGQGRVFLASQISLGDRPVVLKLSARRGDEHLSLARLQHTHIVPLLSASDDLVRHLRILCMPYFGGLTLAAILERLRPHTVDQRAGRHLLQILDAERIAAPVPLPPGRDPVTPFLQRASYVQAVSWIGACLAEALKYAHERGLVHLDLKPSNVLLTADRQPMLLDFHLAREPLRPGDIGIRFGGTPAYMSPEQKRATAAIREGGAARDTIDGRSDIYSLGLVLYWALGGPLPDDGASAFPPLRQCNPQVSTGLSDIIARCLMSRPEQRYPDAGRLAADLWAHLNDAPLKGVANRSLSERWAKWRRRKPHLLALLVLSAVVLVMAGAALVVVGLHVRQRLEEGATALAEGERFLQRGENADAISVLKRELSRLESLPGSSQLKQKLASRLRLAARMQSAQELHDIADRCRFLYGVDFYPSARLRSLEARCRAFWEQRDTILDRVGKDLDPSTEQRVRTDLLDLAILGADLRVRLADPGQVPAARREALQALEQVEQIAGPSAVLFRERQTHAEKLGLTDVARRAREQAARCPPRGAWEHYALGRALLRSDQLEAAAGHLDQAVALQPDGLWPSFYQGVCCHRLGRFEDAAAAFGICTALAPKVAGCFFNRALALAELKRNDRALRDFDHALELDPDFAEAALNRGLLHLREKRLDLAEADFRRAIAKGADPARSHYQLALVSLARNDRAGAVSHLNECRRFDPAHQPAAALLSKLQTLP